MTSVDKRIGKLSALLTDFAAGNFNRHIRLTGPDDAINACIHGANMAAEELKHTAITRDYFTNIFNSVSDMILVLTAGGVIKDANQPACRQLFYDQKELIGKKITHLLPFDTPPIFPPPRYLSGQGKKTDIRTRICRHDGTTIPVQLTAGSLPDRNQRQKRILLTIRDITSEVENENAILRAVIDAQEAERNRLSLDLHDSLGQQITGIKFSVDGLLQMEENEQHRQILVGLRKNLNDVVSSMRDLSFYLMPRSLDEFDLINATRDLCHTLGQTVNVRLHVEADPDFPRLSKGMSIDIFRIIQEFTANALRHGKASNVRLQFEHLTPGITIRLSDDGKGFDEGHIETGRGLQNIRSRVRSHAGEITMTSAPGKGTRFTIIFPFIESFSTGT